MKHLLKEISLTTLAVMLSAHMVPGFAIGATLWQNIIVGLIMTLGYLIVLPMAKVLLIPFRIITFNLATGLAYVALLYLATFFVSYLRVSASTVQLFGLVLPLSLFWSYVAIAALIHFFRSLMRWIFS
jgi:uncharacterized membrane protein YvlD (DUF360 family)